MKLFEIEINWLYVGLALAVLYWWVYIKNNTKREGFETNQRVTLKTSTGKFAKVCAEKHLCLTDNKTEAEQFSVMKFSDDLIALSKGGYYIASCFGDSCKDEMIKVNSFNPYAPNAKLALEKEAEYYYVKFYDDKYMSVDDNNHVIKHSDKSKALRLEIA
jgi:hypothetical protein